MAELTFDEFRDRELKPAYLADRAPNRALLDRRVVCDLLGFDETVYEAVRRTVRPRRQAAPQRVIIDYLHGRCGREIRHRSSRRNTRPPRCPRYRPPPVYRWLLITRSGDCFPLATVPQRMVVCEEALLGGVVFMPHWLLVGSALIRHSSLPGGGASWASHARSAETRI